MREKSLSLLVRIVFVFALVAPVSVAAQQGAEQREGRLKLGADAGVIFGTADEEAFGLNLYGDYFFNQNFSIGPLVQFGFTNDLFKFGPSVQLKYTHDIDDRWKTHVQGGLGFMYAKLKLRGPDPDDTGILFPLGGGIEYRLTDYISIGSTLLLNFMDLDKVRNENFSLSLLGGLKIRF